MTDPKMMAQMVGGAGFIAALDQSGGSTPGALKAYGFAEADFATEEQMFERIHEMRVRIITAPSFNGRKVIAATAVEERPITLDELLSADEAFLASTTRGVQAVRSINGTELPGGEVTRAVGANVEALIAAELRG